MGSVDTLFSLEFELLWVRRSRVENWYLLLLLFLALVGGLRGFREGMLAALTTYLRISDFQKEAADSCVPAGVFCSPQLQRVTGFGDEDKGQDCGKAGSRVLAYKKPWKNSLLQSLLWILVKRLLRLRKATKFACEDDIELL